MRASAELVVGPPLARRPGFRVERMVGQAPLAWRATPDGVYMVSTSATPVGDDQVEVTARVRSGSRLTVRSTAATIAWSGQGTSQRILIDVEAGAHLDWRPEPMVATARCNHHQRADIRLAEGATLRWQEMIVLGRTRELAGRLRSHLSVERAGRPVLRHELSTEVEAVWRSPAVMGRNRVIGMVVALDASWAEVRTEAGEGWAVMPLDAGGSLVLAVGPDVSGVVARLEGLAP